MKKLKVVTVVGTRPEIIRLSRLIPKLDEHTDHILVHTGQNYDPQLSDVFFKDLELRQPDYYLEVDASSFGTVMGETIKKSEEVFIKERPDAVMILGDTNSAVSAIVAERLRIPVFHMEAGNRSFDKRVPEELNRRVVDHVASFNLPYTEHARRNLLAEGIHPSKIFVTGSPLMEVVTHFEMKVRESGILDALGLSPRNFLLVSIHRQENVDSPTTLLDGLRELSDAALKLGLPAVVSTHPRTRARLKALGDPSFPNVRFIDAFGYFDYCKLQLESACVISDSGSISEEAAIFEMPAVTWREANERPEALELACVVPSGFANGNLESAIRVAMERRGDKVIPAEYVSKNFSSRVFNALLAGQASAGKRA